MIPKRIYMKNFMSHKETDIDCTKFDCCLIVGKKSSNDNESNGVGKSTIIKALKYVLYNDYPTNKIEKIVLDGQEKCEVIYEFELNDKDWQVHRQRSNKSKKSQLIVKYKLKDKWEKIDQRTTSQMEKKLKELIKINSVAFSSSVIFSQNSFSDILEATDSERRKLLKEPLSLNVYSKYLENAKNNHKKAEKELSKIRENIINLGNPDEDINQINKELKLLNEELIKQNIILNNNKKELTLNIKEHSSLETLLSSDSIKLTDQLLDINYQQKKCKNTINEYKKRAVLYSEKIDKLSNKINLLNNKIKKEEKNKSNLLNVKIRNEEQIEIDLNDIIKKENKGNLYIADLKIKYEHFSKPLPEGSECTVCFNELTDEYKNKISIENKIKSIEIKNNLNKAKEKLLKLFNKKEKLNNELNSITEHKFKLKELNATILSLKKELKNNKEFLSSTETQASQLIKDIESENEIEKELINKEKALKEKIEKFNTKDINSKLIVVKNNIEEFQEKESLILNEISELNINKGIKEEKKNKRIKDNELLLELNEALIKAKYEYTLTLRIVNAFSDSGIPSLIIHTILDDLQIESNNILQEMRPELGLQFYIEKDDKDVLGIKYSVYNQERDYSQLSGGQKMFISFALKLGLSTIIQKRLDIDLKILALDEVDQPLDKAGRDAFVEIIKKYKNKFKIFVITHDDRLKDKFKHAILVEQDGINGSTGKLVTDW